jgi:hypothetical protein
MGYVMLVDVWVRSLHNYPFYLNHKQIRFENWAAIKVFTQKDALLTSFRSPL